MTEASLEFIARAIDRLTTEVAGQRDELRVQGAILMRLENRLERSVMHLDGTLGDVLAEMRAIHAQISRMNDRIRKLEDAQ